MAFDPTKRFNPAAADREKFRATLSPESAVPQAGFSGATFPENPQPEPSASFVPVTTAAPAVQPAGPAPQPVVVPQPTPVAAAPTPQPMPVPQPVPIPQPVPVAAPSAAELEAKARAFENGILKEQLQQEASLAAQAKAEKAALEAELQQLKTESLKRQAAAAFPKDQIALPANSIDPEDAAAIGQTVQTAVAGYVETLLSPLQARIAQQDDQLKQFAQQTTQQDYRQRLNALNAALYAAIPNIKEWRDSTAWAAIKSKETYPGSRTTWEQEVDRHYANGNADGIINIFKNQVMNQQPAQPSLEDFAQVPATTYGTAPAPAQTSAPGLMSPEELKNLLDLYQARKIPHEEFLAKRKAHREALAANSPS